MGGHGGLGSGLHGRPLSLVLCSNWGTSGNPATRQARDCSNAASQFCKNCKLVAYYSKKCQTQHWQVHKALCTSKLMEKSWVPRAPHVLRRLLGFESEADEEDNVEDDAAVPFTEPLWGNEPSHGVLGSNISSASLPEELRICFVASGDLRNVIETVCELPEDYKGKVTIRMNEASAKVAVRNYIMLELLRIHGSEAIDAVIALWHSLAMTSVQLRAAKMVAKQAQSWQPKENSTKKSAAKYSYSASCGESAFLEVKFEKETMEVMEELCGHRTPLAVARQFREAVMQRSSPRSEENRMACLRPAHRLACHHFRQTGMLLPFGSDARDHIKANRFLLTPGICWVIDGQDDPMYGWDMKQVLATGARHGPVWQPLFPPACQAPIIS